MDLGSMLSTLLIGPLKLIFEVIFSLVNRLDNPGLSIVALSLCMNLLVLPLYRRADAIQDEAPCQGAVCLAWLSARFR